ncbi:MAG: hypothetical protein ACREDF_00615 [Thermoplasmata archaeon]
MTPTRPRAGVAVFDASPLIFFARVGLLRKSLELFAASIIADSVREEVVGSGRQSGTPETPGIEVLLQEGRLTSEAPPETPLGKSLAGNPRLSKADRDSIALASASGARLLADDSAVRAAAKHAGVALGGTLHVLFALVEERSLTPEQGIEHLDRLVDLGWYCSARLYRAARGALEERTRR